MARVYRQDRLITGTVISDTEIGRNLATVAGEMNGGLDRENIPNAEITGAYVAAGTFHQILWITDDVGVTITPDAGDDVQAWYEVSGFADTITTEDGRLEIEAHTTFDVEAGGSPVVPLVDLGVRIDGVLVARSGLIGPDCINVLSAIFQNGCLMCQAAPVVGAGIHLVELVIRPMAKPPLGGTDRDYNLNHTQLWVRYLRR